MFENASIIFRWIAKIISALLIGLFLFLAIDHMLSSANAFDLNANEMQKLFALGLMLIGIFVAFWFEFVGNLLTSSGYIWFSYIEGNWFAANIYGVFVVIVGIYFLAGFFQLLSRNTGKRRLNKMDF